MKRALPFVVAALVVAAGLLLWKGRDWGLFAGGADADAAGSGPVPEEIAGAGGLRGRPGSDRAGPDPATWEGDPVGVLDLGLGKAAVTGKVTGDGVPLRFARVAIVLPPPAGSRAARTTKDGRFEVRGLAAGVVDLRFSAEGRRGKTLATPALVEGKTTDLGEIELKPVPPMTDGLEVKVVDGGGRPVAGARVAASTIAYGLYVGMPATRSGIQGTIAHEGTTDENGVARFFPIPAEKYDVLARAKGYALDAVANVVVTAGRVEKVKIVLQPGLSLSGLVSDLDGQPVPGAYVGGLLIPQFRSYETVQSDANGRFTLDGLAAGTYMLVAGKDGKGEGQAQAAAGKADARIQLKGSGRVEGRVLASDGTPAAKFALRPYTSDFFRYVYSRRIDVSDPDGRFAIDLAPGNYTIDAQAEGGEFKTGTSVSVVAGATAKVEIKLPPLGIVKGVVVNPDGDDVKDAEVYVNVGGFPPSPHREWYARTDADGAFVIKGLPLEPTKLHVRHAAYALSIVEAKPAPAASATEITVRLSAGSRVTGHVTTTGGSPVPGEQVNLFQGFDFFRAKTTFTDASGSYAFTAVAAGTYTLSTGRFENNASGQTKSNVAVPADTVAVVDFQTQGDAEASGKVTGTVTVAGAPAVDATVSAWDERGFEAAVNTKTDAQGKYAVSGLKPGRVNVMIQTEGGISKTETRRIQKAGDAVTADFTFGSGSLTGTLVGPDGRVTVSGGWITLETAELGQGNEVWSGVKGQTNAGDDGRFSWTGLEPGRYRVRVIANNYAARLTDPFALGDGESRDLGSIRLEAGGGIQGRVVDDRGVPVENVGISLKDAQGRPVFLISFTSTGSDGRYALQGIQLGDYTATFDAKGYATVQRPIKIDRAGTTVDVSLPRGGTIAVTVVDEQDKPLEGTRVELLDASGAKVVKTLTIVNLFDSDASKANAQGVATIPDVAPGGYTVRPQRDDLEVVGQAPTITVASGAVSATRLVLKPK